MSVQGGLEFSAPAAQTPATRFRFLGGLDPRLPSFVRLAAERIAALDTAKAIEAALAEVPRGDTLRFIETLAVTAIARRIALAEDPLIRELLLKEVPEPLAHRVAPLAKSYASIRPRARRVEE